MAYVSTYLNFNGNTEAAFLFYESVFKTEFITGRMMRFSDMPPIEGAPPASEETKNMVMHVALPILNGHMLQGTDAPESMGFQLVSGNNVYISLSPDSQEEADQLFNALVEGGKIEMPLQQTFWGAYFGSLTDQFGIRWMVNYNTQY